MNSFKFGIQKQNILCSQITVSVVDIAMPWPFATTIIWPTIAADISREKQSKSCKRAFCMEIFMHERLCFTDNFLEIFFLCDSLFKKKNLFLTMISYHRWRHYRIVTMLLLLVPRVVKIRVARDIHQIPLISWVMNLIKSLNPKKF